MRTNLPVTGVEYLLAPDDLLASTTDLKGRITYCDQAFVEASGFCKDELMGQPHNLIRHPDMPQEAFRDLWHTITAGQPWSGMMKNRRINGDHYWVMANVTPLMDAGAPVGYMSVCAAPTRHQMDTAEILYRRLRRQQSEGSRRLALQGGNLVRGDTLPSLFRAVHRASQRLGFGAVALGLLGCGLSWYGGR